MKPPRSVPRSQLGSVRSINCPYCRKTIRPIPDPHPEKGLARTVDPEVALTWACPDEFCPGSSSLDLDD